MVGIVICKAVFSQNVPELLEFAKLHGVRAGSAPTSASALSTRTKQLFAVSFIRSELELLYGLIGPGC